MRDALAFLTVLPVGRRAGPPGSAGIAAFPVVGLLVGGLWWGAGRFGARLWGPAAGAALVLVVDLLVTGGLHLDGLADEADGIASRLPPAEAVAVMREGTVGAVGASAAAIVALLRFALLSTALAGSHAGAVIAAPAAGRFAMVWVMARDRARRSHGRDPGSPGMRDQAGAGRHDQGHGDSSLASGIREAARGAPLAVSGAIALASGYALAGGRGVIGVACACLAAEGNAAVARRRLAGVTGDVIGAGGLLAETVALALVAAPL